MKDLNTNLLRFPQREQLQADIAQSEGMLSSAKPEDKPIIQSSIARTKRQLSTQSPEPLTPKEKDTLHALEKKLVKRITENMPTEEVMRKNPAGAVDWHTKWERRNKKLIRIWKNIKIQLNPDNSDKDLANIERYRPSGQTDRIRTDAQIVGLHSFTGIDEDQWPFDAPQNTALEQVKRHTMTEAEAEGAVNSALESLDAEELEEETNEEDGKKKPVSPEQHAILVKRLADARAAKEKKRLEELQISETLQAVPDQEI